MPEFERYQSTDTICDENENFVNGFKLVRTEVKPHGSPEFAYIKEETGELLPYRFDIATDFNQYGLAMVGKDGDVTWVDKEFKMLKHDDMSVFKKMQPIDVNLLETGRINGGFLRVQNFTKGKVPLSRVYEGRSSYGTVAFLNSTGTLQKFFKYNGKDVSSLGSTEFTHCSEFDENGIAIMDRGVLLADGFEISNASIINILKEKGTLLEIQEEALHRQKEQEEKSKEITQSIAKNL